MMKGRVEKLLAVVLTIAVCLSNIGVVSASGETKHVSREAEKETEADINIMEEGSDEEDSEIRLTYQITGQWEDHYNVDVTLKNITDERLDNWEIRIPANYEIENIWNAKITDENDEEYTIHNAEWNQDIAVDGSVSFGMTVKCSEEIEIPEYVDTTGLCDRVDEDKYKIEFKKHSQWDNKFNGQIIITNLSDEKIEDWSILMNSDFEIEQIWNAKIADRTKDGLIYYDIENSGNNQNIAPGQSVEFGFIASCEGKPELSGIELYQVTADLDFSEDEDEDEDELEFADEFTLDSDSFETREEYEQYLKENGLTDDSLIESEEPSTRSRARKAPAKGSVECTVEDLQLPSDARATQHYMPLANGDYYLMTTKGNNAFVRKKMGGSMDSKEEVDFVGFAHGQTFEQFMIPKEGEHYLLAGNAEKEFARNLAIMSRSFFEGSVLNKSAVDFENWKKDSSMFRIMTGLAKANKAGVKKGNLTRVDAALTADGSTLVIWKRLLIGKERSRQEISLYNMRKLLKIYKKQRDAELEKRRKEKLKAGDSDWNKSLKLSFAGKRKKALSKACIGTIWENGVSPRNSLLQPNGSLHSIDIEKYIEDGEVKWRIAITSGNEIGRLKPVTITRLEVEKSGKERTGENGITYKAFRDHIAIKGHPGAKLELEGGHIMNDKDYNFILMEKTGGTRKKPLRSQYVASIDLMDIKTRVK